MERGRAAVAVVTQEFEALSRTMATNAGRSGLRVIVLPYPLETLPESEIEDIATRYYDDLLRRMGARES